MSSDAVSQTRSVRSVEGHSVGDLDGEDRRHEEVDAGAERGPPPGAGNEAGSVLPEVFEAMGCVAGYQQPG